MKNESRIQSCREMLTISVFLAVWLTIWSSAANAATLVKTGPQAGDPAVVHFYGVNQNELLANGSPLSCYPSLVKPILSAENIYAPNMVMNGAHWNVYYGGWIQSGQGNDDIFMAVSLDHEPISGWYQTPPSGALNIINHGNYSHVNDASVVRVSPTNWVMAYTAARTGDLFGRTERINIATSTDGATWVASANGNVAAWTRASTTVPATSTHQTTITWSGGLIKSCGRPALAKKGSTWYMWFNGYRTADATNVADFEYTTTTNFSSLVGNGWMHGFYLATSNEAVPMNFTVVKIWEDWDKSTKMPEMDVKLLSDGTTFLGCWRPDWEGTTGMVGAATSNLRAIMVGTSTDGQTWTKKRIALNAYLYPFEPAYINSTCLVYTPDDNRFWGLMWGGCQSDLGRAKIYIGYNLFQIHLRDNLGVWHVSGVSGMNSEFIVNAEGATAFSWVKITNMATGATVIDQAISAVPSDVYTLYQ